MDRWQHAGHCQIGFVPTVATHLGKRPEARDASALSNAGTSGLAKYRYGHALSVGRASSREVRDSAAVAVLAVTHSSAEPGRLTANDAASSSGMTSSQRFASAQRRAAAWGVSRLSRCQKAREATTPRGTFSSNIRTAGCSNTGTLWNRCSAGPSPRMSESITETGSVTTTDQRTSNYGMSGRKIRQVFAQPIITASAVVASMRRPDG